MNELSVWEIALILLSLVCFWLALLWQHGRGWQEDMAITNWLDPIVFRLWRAVSEIIFRLWEAVSEAWKLPWRWIEAVWEREFPEGDVGERIQDTDS